MSERETHDFMRVNSFSQLPFIRPSPPCNNPSNSTSTSAIRLFGIEVPQDPNAQQDPSIDHSATATTNTSIGGSSESGRKFECHYCCRNFPTSQALGGHQNAHKRERQQAKRAHLQSAMAAHHHHYQSTAISGGRHMYGLLNYHYPSWNSSTSGSSIGGQFYGGLGSVSQPIDGSPLPGRWRIAQAVTHSGASVGMMQRDHRTMALPLLGGGGSRVDRNLGSSSSPMSSSSSPQNRVICESIPSVKDNLSLDLHL